MNNMGETTALTLLWMIFSGLSHTVVAGFIPELHLNKTDPCEHLAVFEWQLTGYQDVGPRNCTVDHGASEKFLEGTMTHKTYLNMSATGSFKLNGMNSGEEYSVQIRCGAATSQVVTAKVYDDECGASPDDTVIEYKEAPSLLGGRDSMLGIVFGLFGFLIILVTTVVIWKKYRHRQRLERIRRYLGSSHIDPFENLQLRMDNQESGGSGNERLMGSSDSLT